MAKYRTGSLIPENYNNTSDPVALTPWEKEKLTPEEQAQIIQAKYGYMNAATDAERAGYHNMAEQIRRSKGWHGGTAGNEYNPIPTYNPPTPPQIDPYNSRWDNELNSTLYDLRNQAPYQSPYQDRINRTLYELENKKPFDDPYKELIQEELNNIMNRPDFTYDPEKDAAYQAYKKRAYQLGERAYGNALATGSANTMGRANSWALGSANMARNDYRMQAELAIASYEDRAFQRYQYESMIPYQKLSALQGLSAMEFNKYQAEYNNKIGLLGAIQNLDSFAYQQYRDKITDKRDYANFIMQLDNRDYSQWQFMVENQWKNYEAEFSAYQAELQFNQNEWNNAMDRVNMLGYVDNQSAFTLGVPIGTLSADARIRKNQIEDFFAQQDYMLQNDFELMAKEHEFNKALSSIKQGYDLNTIDYEYGRKADLERIELNYSNYGTTANVGSVLQKASQYLGVPYKRGGFSTESIDCSGLVAQAYGLKRDFTTASLKSNPSKYGFKEIPLEQARVGDVLWKSGHMALLYDANNVIEASEKKHKVVIQTAWKRRTGQEFTKAYRKVGE